ncbi:MAG TPA: hypothetical protein VMZ53_02640 [Kofleriaceae bacterium]|nr:hypothetical protein [Kofleriaceae bacterium]
MTFDAQLRTTLQSIHAKPTPGEARAIIDVARLAAAADKKTDLSETVVLLALSKIVCDMAGVTEIPDPTASIDPKRLMEIGEQLVPQGARELAYAGAFFVMISDLELTKEESQLAAGLADALVLDAGRAKQLASQMEALARSARK